MDERRGLKAELVDGKLRVPGDTAEYIPAAATFRTLWLTASALTFGRNYSRSSNGDVERGQRLWGIASFDDASSCLRLAGWGDTCRELPFTIKPAEPDKDGMSAWRAAIGFIPCDREFRSKDEWFAEAWLPQEEFDTFLAAYRAGEIKRLSFGLKINAWVYAGAEHTPPGWGITWHLVPSQERESQFPETAYGKVDYLVWSDKDANEASWESATAEQFRQSKLDAQIGKWFEDSDPKRGRSSQYRRALDAISRATLEHAEVSNAPLSGGENSFEPRNGS